MNVSDSVKTVKKNIVRGYRCYTYCLCGLVHTSTMLVLVQSCCQLCPPRMETPVKVIASAYLSPSWDYLLWVCSRSDKRIHPIGKTPSIGGIRALRGTGGTGRIRM